MSKVNFWKTHPQKMNRMVDDMVQEFNEMPDKLLLNTFFVRDVDKFLSHKDSKAVLISLITHLYLESTGFAPPTKVKNRILSSLKDGIEIYIHIEEILRLGIMSRDRLIIYQNTGLIDIELFHKHNSVGYQWKVIKQIA